MTKAELVEAVASAAGVTKADAERTIDAYWDTVVKAVKKDDKVSWPGIGSMSLSKRAARTGRNPQTGATIEIAASSVPKFTAGATLKAAVNK